MSLYIYNNIIIMVIYHYSSLTLSIWFSDSEQLLTCCCCVCVCTYIHDYIVNVMLTWCCYVYPQVSVPLIQGY